MSNEELALRFVTVAFLAFIAIVMLRDLRGGLTGILCALFCYSVASYLLCPPMDRHWQLGVLEIPFFFGCFGAAVFFWLMSRAIFDDSFRLRAWHVALLIVVEALGVWRHVEDELPTPPFAAYLPSEVPLVLHQLLSLGITVSALILAFAGRADDLVEARRRFRDVFVGVCGVYSLIIIGTEIYLRSEAAHPALELLNVAAMFAIVFGFAVFMVRLKPGLIPVIAQKSAGKPADQPDPEDERMLNALHQEMTENRAYRVEGLTIGQLAERINTQEYRLRRLINGSLGYRNFGTYINSFRLNEVKDRLKDPESARIPILTIALESGFSSLGPFNRAFKEATGMTPKEYRASHSAD